MQSLVSKLALHMERRYEYPSPTREQNDDEKEMRLRKVEASLREWFHLRPTIFGHFPKVRINEIISPTLSLRKRKKDSERINEIALLMQMSNAINNSY